MHFGNIHPLDDFLGYPEKVREEEAGRDGSIAAFFLHAQIRLLFQVPKKKRKRQRKIFMEFEMSSFTEIEYKIHLHTNFVSGICVRSKSLQ